MSVIAQPRSQVLILSGTVALALAAGICNGLASTAQLEPGRFRPEGLLQYALFVVAVTTAASVAAGQTPAQPSDGSPVGCGRRRFDRLVREPSVGRVGRIRRGTARQP